MSRFAPLALLVALTPTGRADESSKPVSFKADVAPILVRECLGCHDAREAKGGLNMATFALLKKGGKGFGAEILKAGEPDDSYLVELVKPGADPRMPYKQPPLGDAEIATLERWVREGARFDGPSEADTTIASMVDPLANLPNVAVTVPTSDPVASLAYSADGKTLAAAVGRDVILYGPANGKPTATLADHPGPVTSVRITPDGKTLIASGGRPGMFGAVTIWDLATRSRRHDLRGHADGILAADLAPDGKTLATAGYDRLVKLWDVAEGKEIRTLKEHTDAVYAVAFSPDGASLASASGDRTAKVWDVATGRRRVTLSEATAELYAVAFAPDGKTVLAGGVDRSIRAWELKGDNAALARSAFAHDAAVLRLVVSPDGSTLLSSGEDRAIKTWDLATLKPRSAMAGQPDWPLAIAPSPDGSSLAVGRYDGSIALLDPADGKTRLALREAPAASPTKPAEKPKLATNPTLNPPSPRGAMRGSTVKVTLTGNGVGRAESVVFLKPGIEAKVLPREKPDANALDVELAIAPDARVGPHPFAVRTPLGTPGYQNFAVSAYPEMKESEPNDDRDRAATVDLPATLLGTIERPGDVDHVRFRATAGSPLVFEATARTLGSGLAAQLAVLDESGKVLAEASEADEGRDPVLVFRPEADGTYTLRVGDVNFGGSGNHFYRIQAGATPMVKSVFPLGIERGERVTIAFSGVNLQGVASSTFDAPIDPEGHSVLSVSFPRADNLRDNARMVALADGPQAVESEGNDEPASVRDVLVFADPWGVSGRIDRDGDVDHFRFSARKGERRVIEVFAQRLGTPVDPVLEILDAQGRPVPRAVLRPVEETEVAFRDHPSSGRNIRLTQWNDFAVGDYVLIGRELLRMFELPRNPDDDAIFWGLGHARINTGDRVAFLETTPEHHPQNQAIYKVEVHPPGASFPPGGVPPVTLYYRNDDGGPGFGKDARVTFDPPADGDYIARVEDARGLGGDRYGYHLVVRRPRPDFRLTVSSENPSVPRGGATVLMVGLQRIDGFDGPVEVTVEGLPPGITATPTVIEEGLNAADLILTADESAPASSPPTWRLVGRPVGSSPGQGVRRTLDPGGPEAGWITVTGEPNLKIGFRPDRVEIRPGERIEMTLTVERHPAYKGRVPIEVRNLPFGVQVQNIGLNGVLVTEKQAERSIFLYAEPWAKPTERRFYAVGRCEAVGTEHSSAPIPIVVKPARPGPGESASAATP